MKLALYFGEDMSRNSPKWIFGLVNLTSIIFVLISSNEPLIRTFSNSPIEPLFINGFSGNAIIFNLSMGIIVSSIFYFIVVYLPERQKKLDTLPQLEIYITGVLTRTWSLTSDICKHSGKNIDLSTLTQEEFVTVCKNVNPRLIKQQFHNDGVTFFEKDFGYACSNKWDFIVKNIDDAMHLLPYIDTGLIKQLNEIRSSSFSHTVGTLKNISQLKNTDMEAWAICIYKIFQLGEKLEYYYKQHLNSGYQHPFKKI